MIVTCIHCPSGNVQAIKPPYDKDEETQSLCRFHLLKDLKSNKLVNYDEVQELLAWARAFRSRRGDVRQDAD